jgi:hypothetical protein
VRTAQRGAPEAVEAVVVEREARTIGHGAAARTPFVVIAAVAVVIAIVVGLVIGLALLISSTG